jgi:hypothetical protein
LMSLRPRIGKYAPSSEYLQRNIFAAGIRADGMS